MNIKEGASWTFGGLLLSAALATGVSSGIRLHELDGEDQAARQQSSQMMSDYSARIARVDGDLDGAQYELIFEPSDGGWWSCKWGDVVKLDPITGGVVSTTRECLDVFIADPPHKLSDAHDARQDIEAAVAELDPVVDADVVQEMEGIEAQLPDENDVASSFQPQIDELQAVRDQLKVGVLYDRHHDFSQIFKLAEDRNNANSGLTAAFWSAFLGAVLIFAARESRKERKLSQPSSKSRSR